MNKRYADRLCDAINTTGSPACVGIDPVFERLPEAVRDSAKSPADAIRSFCLGVLDAIDPGRIPAVKPQSACFERFGSAGVSVLEDVIAKARERGFLVVLDVKRGDIGSTADHYSAAAVRMGADAVTVNGYMGRSAVQPFIDAGLGVYVLVRTSNPDSDELQAETLTTGGSVASRLAAMTHDLGSAVVGDQGMSDVGAVIGATKQVDEVAALRAAMPCAPVLVPGVGAQGGTIEQVRPLARPGANAIGEAGVLINASRSVLYPGAQTGVGAGVGSGLWTDAVRIESERFADLCATLLG